MSRRTLVACALVLSMSSYCHADLVEIYRLDTGGAATFSGNTATYSKNLVADGVSFTGTLIVTGNGSTVERNSNGMGVDGTTINNGESLTFTLSLSNISGGSVVFDGFTAMDFNSYTAAGNDSATLNGNALGNTNLDVLDLQTAPFNSPTSILLAGNAAGTSFQIDDVSLRFSGTAVPEPNSAATILLGLACCGLTRLRRR